MASDAAALRELRRSALHRGQRDRVDVRPRGDRAARRIGRDRERAAHRGAAGPAIDRYIVLAIDRYIVLAIDRYIVLAIGRYIVRASTRVSRSCGVNGLTR